MPFKLHLEGYYPNFVWDCAISVSVHCHGELIFHPLYQFDVTDNITDAYGNITVIGSHKKLGGISDNLKRRMLDNGVPAGKLKPFLPDAPCKEGGK